MFQISSNSTDKYKMRTPKHKRMIQKAKNTATGKLRKKVMRNKMYKKTLLEVGGDDTREDVRDLMNESDMSFNGVVSFYLALCKGWITKNDTLTPMDWIYKLHFNNLR